MQIIYLYHHEECALGSFNFPKAFFWDINEKDIERTLADSKEWVMVRVFQYGNLDDIDSVIALYGKQRTAEILAKSELPPVAGAMAFLFLGVDPTHKYA